MDFVIYDTEYTTWEGAMARKWLGDNEYKEIIQIGALKVSFPDFTVQDSLKVYIKPQKNPMLSDYCKKLTGISQAEIDSGVMFTQGLSEFLRFCDGCLAGSYGNDGCVLSENALINREDPQGVYGAYFINLAYWVKQFGKQTEGLNSGKLWTLVPENERKFDKIREHDALNDCYSILEMLRYMHKLGYNLPFQK